MGFMLNVARPFQAKPRVDKPVATLMVEARQLLQSQAPRSWLTLREAAMAGVGGCLVLTVSMVTLRPTGMGIPGPYDMTPTSSIAKPTAAAVPMPKSKSCD